MKKQGFTLIELLAVIVILAIIALIATPIVMNVIENSRRGAAERSTENYLNAVETAIATKRLEDSTIANGEYVVNSEGNLCQIGGSCLTVEVSGEQPRNGSTVVISEGIIVKESTNIIVNNYDVKYNTESEKFEASDYNPYGYGTKYVFNPGDGNRLFYVLEDGDATTLTTGRIAQAGEVSLILDRNIDNQTLAWCKEGTSTACKGDGVIEYLNTKVEELGWTIEASLPTAYQMIKASGVSGWSYSQTTASSKLAEWLILNINTPNASYSNKPFGYWTSTAHGNTAAAWSIVYTRNLVAPSVDASTSYGVRPVITISKTDLPQ